MKKILPFTALIIAIVIIGSFLLIGPFVKSRNSLPSPSQKLPASLVNPTVISNPQQIVIGRPFKLTEKEDLMLFAKVKKVIPHPKNSDEYQLFLSTNGKGLEIEKTPFTIRPIFTGDKETPGRETYIYHSQVNAQGKQEQTTASTSDLVEGAMVSVVYKINPNDEIFVISLGIQT